jgi:hypothetical protein
MFLMIPVAYRGWLREARLVPFVSCLVVFFIIVEVKGDFIWGSAMNMKLFNIVLLSALYL